MAFNVFKIDLNLSNLIMIKERKPNNRPIKDKNIMIYIEDILIYIDKNCHLFKNGLDYM